MDGPVAHIRGNSTEKWVSGIYWEETGYSKKGQNFKNSYNSNILADNGGHLEIGE